MGYNRVVGYNRLGCSTVAMPSAGGSTAISVIFVLYIGIRCAIQKDLEPAFELYSPRAQRQMTIADLDVLLQGNNYVLIEGYQSLQVVKLNIKAVANINPDLPQGIVAEVTGIVSYEDNFTGKFNAILEKVDGEWFLHYMNITVPPDKLGP